MPRKMKKKSKVRPIKKKKKIAKRKSSVKSKKTIRKKTAGKKAVKKAKKKPARAVKRKKAPETEIPVLPWRVALEGESLAGIVDDYYQHVSVIALFTKLPLKLGDRIHVRGSSTDFTQIISSMQIEHGSVEQVGKGDGVGIKVDQRAHKGNFVYKVNN